MKKMIVLVSLFLAVTAQAKTISCPKGKKVSWGITTAIPKNIESLKELSVAPPFYGKPNEWSINDVVGASGRPLYLSCALKNGKMFSKLIPLKGNSCLAVNYSTDLEVKCGKN